MEELSIYEDLQNIDQLNEGIDWFKGIYGGSQLEIAKRIKATPTASLKSLVQNANDKSGATQAFQLSIAKKELALRTANDNNPNGDPRYTSKIAGYDKINKSIEEQTIEDYISEDNAKSAFQINSAINRFFEEKNAAFTLDDSRKQKIVSIITESEYDGILRYFIKENPDIHNKDLLFVKESYQTFLRSLTEDTYTPGKKERVVCAISWGPVRVGEEFDALWKKTNMPNQIRLNISGLPRGTIHPSIFYHQDTKQLSMPKQFKLL